MLSETQLRQELHRTSLAENSRRNPTKNRIFSPLQLTRRDPPHCKRRQRARSGGRKRCPTCSFAINHGRARSRGAAPSGSELPPRHTTCSPGQKPTRKIREESSRSAQTPSRSSSGWGPAAREIERGDRGRRTYM